MAYHIKEMFLTLQGEGAQAGRAAVFCRFAGCNLWSGREADRAGAACDFCDTDFVGTDGPGGGVWESAEAVAGALARHWGEARGPGRIVVFTGGEPALQLDAALVAAAHDAGFEVAVETNGTLPLPPGIEWVCVSPKGAQPLAVRSGAELKLVYPQPGVDPGAFENLDFGHFFLQPMAGAALAANTAAAAAYCLARPRWRLCLQMHKFAGLP